MDATRTTARVSELLLLVGLEPAQYCIADRTNSPAASVSASASLAPSPPTRHSLMERSPLCSRSRHRRRASTRIQRLARRLGKTIVLCHPRSSRALLLASRIHSLENGRIIADAFLRNFPASIIPKCRPSPHVSLPLPVRWHDPGHFSSSITPKSSKPPPINLTLVIIAMAFAVAIGVPLECSSFTADAAQSLAPPRQHFQPSPASRSSAF